MSDPGYLLSIQIRMEAIKAEIEGAKQDNVQRQYMSPGGSRNYPPEWFFDKARELQDLSNEIFKY